MKSSVCFCAIALAMTTSLEAGERLAVRVTPAVSFAPANLVVRTMVEANSANRWMQIVAESADFYRSSEIELDGDRAPRSTMFEFRSVPSGTYRVRAVLFGPDGEQRAQVQSVVNVVDAAGQR